MYVYIKGNACVKLVWLGIVYYVRHILGVVQFSFNLLNET